MGMAIMVMGGAGKWETGGKVMGGRAVDGNEWDSVMVMYRHLWACIPNGWNWCMLLSFHLFLLFFYPSSPILLCAMAISAFIR